MVEVNQEIADYIEEGKGFYEFRHEVLAYVLQAMESPTELPIDTLSDLINAIYHSYTVVDHALKTEEE